MRLLITLFLITSAICFGDYTLQDGKLVERKQVATKSAQDHHSNVLELYQSKNWKALEKESLIVLKNFAPSPFARDATYFLGVAYFYQDDFEMANYQFTDYLTSQSTPKYFEEAIQYKFEIAEQFRGGARKHLMGFKSMPKWLGASSEAISIYDEVISALPHHNLAAHSYFGKAQVYVKKEDWRSSIESYQTLIRRFPKHPLAVESFIGIGEVHLKQSQSQYPDPDYLDLAELNLRKFRSSFPNEEKLSVAEKNYAHMRDQYALDLFETARFYERTNKWGAAKIYYTKIVNKYPHSYVAEKSHKRLDAVQEKIDHLETRKGLRK